MKNKRVKINDRVGTVVANPYRFYNQGVWGEYAEVLMDDTGYIEGIRMESLEVL